MMNYQFKVVFQETDGDLVVFENVQEEDSNRRVAKNSIIEYFKMTNTLPQIGMCINMDLAGSDQIRIKDLEFGFDYETQEFFILYYLTWE